MRFSLNFPYVFRPKVAILGAKKRCETRTVFYHFHLPYSLLAINFLTHGNVGDREPRDADADECGVGRSCCACACALAATASEYGKLSSCSP